jgi:hypothetical protein
MSDHDLIKRGDVVSMLLAMRGPVDVPRTEKAIWLDEGIDRCVQELRDFPADPRVEKLVEALRWQADQPEAHPFMAQNARAALAAWETDHE